MAQAQVVTDLSRPIMSSDPFPTFARLREEAPVSRVKTEMVPRGAWLLTRYEDVVAMHGDVRFSSDMQKHARVPLLRWMPKPLRLLLDSMVFKDDPEHRRLRALVNKAFTPSVIQRLAPEIERIADELLDRMAGEPGVDLVKSFALPLPLAIISEMLGVSERDRERFHGWVKVFLDAPAAGPLHALLALPTAYKMMGLFRELAAQRRVQPDDRLITQLLRASEGDDRLSEQEILAMIFLLLLAGHETTANLIGNGTLALLDNPDQLALLRAQPDLIDSAVEELLRFTSPVVCGAPRIALEDVEIAGVVIPRGSQVIAVLSSANRDASQFDEPDRLDIQRDPNRHVAFGLGIHFCLGAQLARLEGRIAFSSLLARFPRIELGVPRGELRWKASQTLRGLRSLPLRLS